MTRRRLENSLCQTLCCFFALSISLTDGMAQAPIGVAPPRHCTVIPSSRVPVHHRGADAPVIEGVTAAVEIRDCVAVTTLDIALFNPGARRVESDLLLPVPNGAVVRGFAYDGSATAPTAHVLPAAEARRLYDEIVRREQDPALLEFSGASLLRTSLFPIESGGRQHVRVTYEEVLVTDQDRVDYVLERSAALDYLVPWKIEVNVTSTRPLVALFSPSHRVLSERRAANVASVRLEDASRLDPGAFRLSILRADGDAAASLFAYPDASGASGYFLLLAGLPVDEAPGGTAPLRRELTLVLDRSGSMAGEKIDQVRAAAMQIVAGLGAGETFNIIAYNDCIERLATSPVEKSAESERAAREFLHQLRAGGGTNIHAALSAALARPPTALASGILPIVLFLTDGLPTVGETSEASIARLAIDANPLRRRIFTFGVGADVNSPLLEKLASASRARATFATPGENVERKVSQVFERLAGPVLADLELTTFDAMLASGVGRIADLQPAVLPDLYSGEPLVVLGRYRGAAPLALRLSGRSGDRVRAFELRFALGSTGAENAFVPRLWASRRIAALVAHLRDLGAEPAAVSLSSASLTPPADPRRRELVDEIVRLSKEFGILTEYTSFLAREGVDLAAHDALVAETSVNMRERVEGCRTGLGAVNQGINRQWSENQSCLNLRNTYIDAELSAVEIVGVQQIADRAFFRRNGRWTDSRLLDRTSAESGSEIGAKIIEVGTPQHASLLDRLTSEKRQACLSLAGDILMLIDGEVLLVRPTQTSVAGPPRTESF
ncbi:MAG: VWA domain-containing protein [Planctomycetota bacterium]